MTTHSPLSNLAIVDPNQTSARAPARSTVDRHDELSRALAVVSPKRACALRDALLERYRCIGGVLNAPIHEIESIPGIEPLETAFIAALSSVHQRALVERVPRGCNLTSLSLAVDYLRDRFHTATNESLVILLLDKKNRLIREMIVSEGSVDFIPFSLKRILRLVIMFEATSVILAHNHPSGDPTPSASDREMTQLLIDSLSPLDVVLHDHFVIGEDEVFSMKLGRACQNLPNEEHA